MEPEALREVRFTAQRRQLNETMREQGIDDLLVLEAFDRTPRHVFLPESVWHRAYEDAPVPIGFGQTASQPSLQAFYLQGLRLSPSDRVLEIGTGSGYQTAVAARLASQVYSVERIRALSVRARRTLDRLRISNVALLVGDGTLGWSRYAPYDAILVAAAAPGIPLQLVDQLAEGGRLMIPIGDRDEQVLTVVRRTPTGVTRDELIRCSFVPLIGKFGWSPGGSVR